MTWNSSKLRLIFFGLVLLLAISFLPFHETYASTYKGEEVEDVHSLYWLAKLKTSYTINYKGKSKKLSAGTKIVLKKFSTSYTVCSAVWKGASFTIPTSKFSVVCDLATSGDYSVATKLWFVNKHLNASSKTKWFIWVCMDKQVVNIYSGSTGKWKLVRSCSCSTGKAGNTTLGYKVISMKKEWHEYLHYFVSFGGNGFHVWPGSGQALTLGRHTASHGCCRLSYKNAKWLYENIPVGTKCYFY